MKQQQSGGGVARYFLIGSVKISHLIGQEPFTLRADTRASVVIELIENNDDVHTRRVFASLHSALCVNGPSILSWLGWSGSLDPLSR